MLYSQIPVIKFDDDSDLIEIVKDFGIDCIHTHHTTTENLVVKSNVRNKLNVCHIVTMHGMYELIKDTNGFIRKVNENVDQWCYIADKNLEPFKKQGIFKSDKFIKVNNGIFQSEIQPIERKTLGISANSFVICLASRAMVEKGWQEAIDAVGIARENTKLDIHLLLLGNGKVYDELRDKKLPGHIHLLGFVSNVMSYFSCSDLGLLPSFYKGESFPLVIMECLSVGKPVVATNIGEIRNMITDENNDQAGILIDLENDKLNVSTLARAIIKISTDKILYNKCLVVANRVKKNFSIDPISDQYIKIYKKNYLKKNAH